MDTTTKKKSTFAMVGMIVGFVSLVLSPMPVINNFAALLAVVALICGIIALIQSKRGKKRGDFKTPVTIVLAVLSIIVVIASQAFYVSVLNDAGNAVNTAATDAQNNVDKMTGDKTEELLKTDVSVVIGAFAATSDEYGFVTTVLPVTVTNKNTEKKTYTVQIEAVNAKGERVIDATIYANDLGAGQSQQLKAFEYVETDKLEAMKAATFKIVSVSQY